MRAQLEQLAEEEYRAFTAKLLPGVTDILGVRVPKLRALAKDIAKRQPAYLQAQPTCFEETMLQGFVIGYLPYDEQRIAAFVPYITNWSLCDSFCTSLKSTKAHREEMWRFLQPYFRSDQPYAIRFAVVMSLMYFIDEHYIEQLFRRYDAITNEHYYVRMAVAWALSMCYVKQPVLTYSYLQQHSLDDQTHRMTIQKIIDSTRPTKQQKAEVRALRRSKA